jgi:hypothetical protein
MTDPTTEAARVLGAHRTARRRLLVGGIRDWICDDCRVSITRDGSVDWALAAHQAQMLAEAGLLAAPSVVQVGPSLGANLGPVLEAILEVATDGAAFDFDSAESALQTAQRRGAALDKIQDLVMDAQDRVAALDAHSAVPQAPADPPAGVESGQGRIGAVRGAGHAHRWVDVSTYGDHARGVDTSVCTVPSCQETREEPM